MVHDGVARNRHFDDVRSLNARLCCCLCDQLVHCRANLTGHLAGTFRLHQHIGHATHEVFTEANLRVHGTVRGDDIAGCQVRQVQGHRC